MDVCVMFNDGTIQTFSPKDFDIEKIKTQGAWQAWTFGPMLLKDGQPMKKEEFNSGVNTKNPRSAIGYFEPGHYCFLIVDGRQAGYSGGMSTEEMSQLFFDLGCKAAFNLDGGQSAEMAYMGELANKPFDGGRSINDILYIADE
jgi:exopolysaccharide biosynthesis protein